MLLANPEQELFLGVGEIPTTSTVASGSRAQGLETARLVGVVPALERCDGVRLGGFGAWGSEPLLAELGKGLSELAAIELATGERTDDLAAVERNGFGGIFGGERLHLGSPRFPLRGAARPP